VQNVTPPPSPPPFALLHTLRAPVREFTGRTDEVRDLAAYLSQDGATAAIAGIRGIGGIGKTELALVAAHGLLDRYPDAQLLLELQPGAVPLAPERPCSAA